MYWIDTEWSENIVINYYKIILKKTVHQFVVYTPIRHDNDFDFI
jgi:hypothetical protein